MPPTQQEILDIERLLGELHRKKRWLDAMIEGLEEAVHSPQLQLLDAVQAVFEDGQTPRVDIPADYQTLLLVLASQIPRRGLAPENRSSSINATEAA